jgi:hypothetical protein
MPVDIEALQAEGKLQVKVARAVSRQRLELIGNVLLVSFLYAYLFLIIWTVVWSQLWGTPFYSSLATNLLGISVRNVVRVNAVAMAGWKICSWFIFFMPGLACKTVAKAMGED